jgi:hypothetical protein
MNPDKIAEFAFENEIYVTYLITIDSLFHTKGFFDSDTPST